MTLYRHYKGGVYELVIIANHSETQEKMVVYKNVDNGKVWVRPFEMFFEKVLVGGTEVPRFEQMK